MFFNQLKIINTIHDLNPLYQRNFGISACRCGSVGRREIRQDNGIDGAAARNDLLAINPLTIKAHIGYTGVTQ